ncbi:hypothetical protein Droror1_Dr00024443 [Drosera rotundifolia]
MQALVMDLVLVFSMILTRLFEPGGGGNGVGFKVDLGLSRSCLVVGVAISSCSPSSELELSRIDDLGLSACEGVRSVISGVDRTDWKLDFLEGFFSSMRLLAEVQDTLNFIEVQDTLNARKQRRDRVFVAGVFVELGFLRGGRWRRRGEWRRGEEREIAREMKRMKKMGLGGEAAALWGLGGESGGEQRRRIDVAFNLER